MFQLHDLQSALIEYIQLFTGPQEKIIFDVLDVWYKFHLQLYSAFNPHIIMPSQVIQAYPPSHTYPLGNCDAALSQENSDSERLP